jgi:hypothetical protein
MRQGQIVKGFCPVCLKFRAFQVTEWEQPYTKIYQLGSLQGTPVPTGYPLYRGNCSAGHNTHFNRVHSGLEPRRGQFPKRSSDLKKHQFGRGVAAYALHVAEQLSFKRPTQEEHYKKGHVCEWGCPEYPHEPIMDMWYGGDNKNAGT